MKTEGYKLVRYEMYPFCDVNGEIAQDIHLPTIVKDIVKKLTNGKKAKIKNRLSNMLSDYVVIHGELIDGQDITVIIYRNPSYKLERQHYVIDFLIDDNEDTTNNINKLKEYVDDIFNYQGMCFKECEKSIRQSNDVHDKNTIGLDNPYYIRDEDKKEWGVLLKDIGLHPELTKCLNTLDK